jgi:ribonuclease HII
MRFKTYPQPEYIIVDGNSPFIRKKGKKTVVAESLPAEILTSIPNSSIVKGDAKFMSIAAASVLAKTYRMII